MERPLTVTLFNLTTLTRTRMLGWTVDGFTVRLWVGTLRRDTLRLTPNFPFNLQHLVVLDAS